MAIKNILVQLVPYLQEDAPIELAAALAHTHGAKLSGLCVLPVSQIPGFARSLVSDEMLAHQRHRSGCPVETIPERGRSRAGPSARY